ncbi:MAG TPA: DUF2157 domain-containing protein [Puia sp.]
MDIQTFQRLCQEGLISEGSLKKVEAVEKHELFSVHWELKTILYLGVTLVSGGLGILVYKNIDSIGHQVILATISLVSLGCFYYCRRVALPFSWEKVPASNPFFDYVLLLGCLTMITFVAYLQYAYGVFGNRFGLATFIPMVVLFFCAYSFDHLGVLNLAITNLAAWMGIAITPLRIFKDNSFEDRSLLYVGLLLGVILLLAALITERKNIKKHFAFTYNNFGTHILFISGLAILFISQRSFILWFLLILVIAFFIYRRAIKKNSFYFFLLATLYTYFAVSYAIVTALENRSGYNMNIIYIDLLYFILSSIFLVRLLISVNRKMKANDSV